MLYEQAFCIVKFFFVSELVMCMNVVMAPFVGLSRLPLLMVSIQSYDRPRHNSFNCPFILWSLSKQQSVIIASNPTMWVCSLRTVHQTLILEREQNRHCWVDSSVQFSPNKFLHQPNLINWDFEIIYTIIAEYIQRLKKKLLNSFELVLDLGDNLN